MITQIAWLIWLNAAWKLVKEKKLFSSGRKSLHVNELET
jgi:hypothetical protein